MTLQDPAEPGVLTRKLMQRIVNCVYEFPPEVRISGECQDLLANIFVTDPKQRISSYDIPNHPW